MSGRAPSEGQGGQLHTCVAADRKAVVRLVANVAILVDEPVNEPLEAVLRGKVHGDREVLRGYPVVIGPSSVEGSAVASEDEDRRQREHQQGQWKPSGLQGGLESVEGDHALELGDESMLTGEQTTPVKMNSDPATLHSQYQSYHRDRSGVPFDLSRRVPHISETRPTSLELCKGLPSRER